MKPGIDEPPVGTSCPTCHREIHLVDPPFCSFCHDEEMQDLERRIRASEALMKAKRRAKAWMLGRAVGQ